MDLLVLARFALNSDIQPGGVITSSRQLYSDLSRFGVDFYCVDSYSYPSHKYINYIFVLTKAILGIFKCNRISLNLNNNELFFFGLPICILSKIFLRKVVIRVFGGDLDLIAKKSFFHKYSIFFLIHLANIFYVQTYGLKEIFNKENVLVLPTSRNPKQFPPKEFIHSTKSIKALYLGGVNNDKGHQIILDSRSYFLKNNMHVFIAGHGCDSFSYDSPFINLEFLSPELVSTHLSDVDVLLFPSQHVGEGYPGSIIESLMIGTPVIASKWRFLPELIQEGYNGFLFNNTLPSFYDALDKFLCSDRFSMYENCLSSGAKFSNEINKKLIFF